jgi:diacylglycerol kinase (ATP)
VARAVVLASVGAGAMTPEVLTLVAAAFPDHRLVEFDPERDVLEQVGEAREVVVAGGDGTMGLVLRALAGSGRRVGLLALGTYNNFARSLGIPEDLEEAIEVVRTGRPRAVTLGRVSGQPFLEAAAVGRFGQMIVLGEAAKDLAFGELAERLSELREVRTFRYRLSGDLEGQGTALSLVFSNTPTTGAHLEVGDATPDDPFLELVLGAAVTRGMLSRFVATLLRRPRPGPTTSRLHFRRLTIRTDPPVNVYADGAEVGRTPVTVEAWPNSISVIQPH